MALHGFLMASDGLGMEYVMARHGSGMASAWTSHGFALKCFQEETLYGYKKK